VQERIDGREVIIQITSVNFFCMVSDNPTSHHPCFLLGSDLCGLSWYRKVDLNSTQQDSSNKKYVSVFWMAEGGQQVCAVCTS
jgi:hypothetical protein